MDAVCVGGKVMRAVKNIFLGCILVFPVSIIVLLCVIVEMLVLGCE